MYAVIVPEPVRLMVLVLVSPTPVVPAVDVVVEVLSFDEPDFEEEPELLPELLPPDEPELLPEWPLPEEPELLPELTPPDEPELLPEEPKLSSQHSKSQVATDRNIPSEIVFTIMSS